MPLVTAKTEEEQPAKLPGMPEIDDSLFRALFGKCKPFSLLTPEKFYNLYMATNYVCNRQVQGDIIECGVWKGGALLMISEVLAHRETLNYDIYAYDTFHGFVERSPNDVDRHGVAIGNIRTKSFLEETRRNVALSPYPADKIHFRPGDVRETVKWENHHHIAMLLLDTDTYGSTLHELNTLYDRVVTGGVIIIDDYGYSRGCRDAVEEFFSTRPRLFLHRTNVGARTAIKV